MIHHQDGFVRKKRRPIQILGKRRNMLIKFRIGFIKFRGLNLVQIMMANKTDGIRRPTERLVAKDNRLTIPCHLDIQRDALCAIKQCLPKGDHRIFGEVFVIPAVGINVHVSSPS